MKLTAHHSNVSGLGHLLRGVGAPTALQEEAREQSATELWDGCAEPSWLLWIAAVERVPMVALVLATSQAVRRTVQKQFAPSQPTLKLLDLLEKFGEPDDCLAAAVACEDAFDDAPDVTYRKAAAYRQRQLALAAGMAARAAEGLVRAEIIRATARETEARARGASVGMGTLGTPLHIPVVFDLDDHWLIYSLDSAVNALRILVESLDAPSDDEKARLAHQESIANIVYTKLNPIRLAVLREGDLSGLIPAVEASLYTSQESGYASQESGLMTVDGDAPLVRRKKPWFGFVSAFLWPLGGGGHLFADHNDTAKVLMVGFIGGFVLALAQVLPIAAPVMIALVDAALAPAAVKRRNAGAPLSTAKQRLLGVVMVAVAYGVAFLATAAG